MADKDFIIKKLELMQKDKQKGFKELVEPLQDVAENNALHKTVDIPVDGNWFTVSFKAVEVNKNRLVIEAKRKKDGLIASSGDPSLKEYVVEFSGTRAAYLYGFYKPHHPIARWPYIYWDIRAYTNHPADSSMRIYVNGFRARDELRRLIVSMESIYGTSNIVNKYIKDNLFRVQSGIKAGKSIQDIEKTWSQGLMESLGYNYVEGFDIGFPKGTWEEVEVHWCKNRRDIRGRHA